MTDAAIDKPLIQSFHFKVKNNRYISAANENAVAITNQADGNVIIGSFSRRSLATSPPTFSAMALRARLVVSGCY